MAKAVQIPGGGEMIRLPNTLAGRIGPRLKVFTAALVKTAEAALERVSARFGPWLQEEIDGLDKARATLPPDGAIGADAKVLSRPARNLRSVGATFGYPLVSRVAASLCVLLQKSGPKPLLLIDGHIDAIRVVVRDDIRDERDVRALATCVGLEEEVARLG